MDHINFERDVLFAEKLGIDYLHVDVMDGLFVPRYGIYPEIVKRISQISNLPMDLHLMVDLPELAIDYFSNFKNIKYISIHIEENEKDILRIIDKIKSYSKLAGIVLNLNTSVHTIKDLIKFSEIDSLTFMGIHPGVLTQVARPNVVIDKVKRLSELCHNFKKVKVIQCDGGVSFNSIPDLAKVGINNFVCGSSTLYKGVKLNQPWSENKRKIKKNYYKIKELIK